MGMQAPSFDLEREARVTSPVWKSQDVSAGAFQTHDTLLTDDETSRPTHLREAYAAPLEQAGFAAEAAVRDVASHGYVVLTDHEGVLRSNNPAGEFPNVVMRVSSEGAVTVWKSQSVSAGAFQTHDTRLQPTFTSRAQPMVKDWLRGALEHVDRIDQEAREEGYPPIGDVAKRNARRVLFIAANSSLEPVVYASMDGEIAVYFKSSAALAALLILLDNEGGAGCYWSLRGKGGYQRHGNASELPDSFVRTQLRALGGSPLSQSFG